MIKQIEQKKKELNSLTPRECQGAIGIASVFAFRMLGLFMILPVVAFYQDYYTDSTAFLLGLAVGIYGLTQALCQIPCGILSDKFGRKPVVLIGLGIFTIGSLIAGVADNIYGLMLGRALQGAGAIGAVLIAWVADITRPVVRTKAMAIVGATIGCSFSLAFILGPIIDGYVGLSGIFYLSSLLGLIGLAWVYWGLASSPPYSTPIPIQIPVNFFSLIKLNNLWRFNIGVACLHAILTASFLFIPLLVSEYTGLSRAASWQFYCPILLLSFIFVFPLASRGGDTHRLAPVFTMGSIVLLGLTQGFIGLFTHHTGLSLFLALTLFFTAFNFLEASMPAALSRMAPVAQRGAVLGMYATCQFMGIFIGGALGGILQEYFGVVGLVSFIASMVCIRFILMLTVSKSIFKSKGDMSWQEG